MTEQFDELDISQIKIIPSDTEIPVNDFPITTKRNLCTNTPENLTLLDRIDAVLVITDIEDNIETNPQLVCQIAKLTIEDLQAVFNPTSVTECSSDLFTETVSVIDTLTELRHALSEVLIRFDTSPNHYTKDDYFTLLKVLYLSLYYLYTVEGLTSVTDIWTGVKETGNVAKATNELYGLVKPDGETISVLNGVISASCLGKEDTVNKVTSLSASSTDTLYPSAKCVYDLIVNAITQIDNA